MKVKRELLVDQVEAALKRSRCVGLVGPRQCGKSTLARHIARKRNSTYFDLEDPTSEARLVDAKLALEPLQGLIVIDEVQLRKDIFPLLRVLLDRDPLPARFLLLGSAAPDLIRSASESLAGRIEFIEMRGFSIDELNYADTRRLWNRGSFPLSWLAESDFDSFKWRQAFIQAFCERDLRLLGVDLPPVTVRRFLTMLAHYHGRTWNGSEIGRSLQLSHPTIRRYLDLMSGALLVRQLQPWFVNIGKRLVKAPKVYLRDSGLLHSLLGLQSMTDIESHPLLGASWEGFALETLISWRPDCQPYYWATHGGAKLDLCWMDGPQRIGVEFKYSSAPSVTKSMRIALEDLKLDHIYVVHPGEEKFPLAKNITATGLKGVRELLSLLEPVVG